MRQPRGLGRLGQRRELAHHTVDEQIFGADRLVLHAHLSAQTVGLVLLVLCALGGWA